MWAMCLFVCACVFSSLACGNGIAFVWDCVWVADRSMPQQPSSRSLFPSVSLFPSLSLSQAYTHTHRLRHTHTQGSSWLSIAVPLCIMGSAGCLNVNCEPSVPLSQLSHWLAHHQCHFSKFLFCFFYFFSVVFGQITPTHGFWDIVVFAALFFLPFYSWPR